MGVGGGINGAAIARLALRGHSVLLLEANDFGLGTTWRSTKLIHGGLRYLEHAEFSLVFEALRDQAVLLRAYPDMVQPLQLLLPVFDGNIDTRPASSISVCAYTTRSRLGARNAEARPPVGGADAPSRANVTTGGLRAAFAYYDCQVAYPERLCLQTLQEARALGAEAVSHTPVLALARAADGTVCGVRVRIVRPIVGTRLLLRLW